MTGRLDRLERGGSGIAAYPGLTVIGQSLRVDGDIYTLKGTFDPFAGGDPSSHGFSANPVGVIARYTLAGKMCTIWVQMPNQGTSNAANFAMDLPFVAATIPGMYWANPWYRAYSGGSPVNGAGNVGVGSGNAYCLAERSVADVSFSTWSTTGGKSVSFTLTYEIA